MIYNNTKGIMSSAAINIPWAGGVEIENLKDIALLTGATLIDNKHDILLEDIKLEHFGKCKHIKVTEYETSIVDGNCDKDKLNERIE